MMPNLFARGVNLRQLGFSISVTPCTTEFDGWKRTHKRRRIAKKWRKRYGAKWRCMYKAYQIGDMIHVCPCVYAAMQKNIDTLTEILK